MDSRCSNGGAIALGYEKINWGMRHEMVIDSGNDCSDGV